MNTLRIVRKPFPGDWAPIQHFTIRDETEPTVSLWQDVQRLKELAVVFVAALVVGFGLGIRRERIRWQGRI